MDPGKQSSRPSDADAGSSRPSKKLKSISNSSENTMGCCMQELMATIRDLSGKTETMVQKNEELHHKIETVVQKNEELQKEVNELKEIVNMLQTPTDTNQIRSSSEKTMHGRSTQELMATDQLPDTETDANQNVIPDLNLIPHYDMIQAEQQSQEDIVHNQNNLVNRRLILKKMSIAVKFVIYLRRDHLFNYMSMLDLDQMVNWNMGDFNLEFD